MNHTKREVKTETVETITHMTCDICGKDSKHGYGWEDRSYDRRDTEISMEEGEIFPEGGSYVRTEYHVCPQCFKGVIIPFFMQHNAIATVTEEDV